MDKVRKYRRILAQYLTDFAKQPPYANMPEVKTTILIDLKGNHFQAVDIGWAGAKYIFSPIFHFDIKDGKIWFQCNNTDKDVIDELIEMGVKQNDIVLGFQPPYVRSQLAL
jgi:XisI protein